MKPFPQSKGAEDILISQCLQEPTLIPQIRELLSPSDFYQPHVGALFGLLVRLQASDRPIDMMTLHHEIEAGCVDIASLGGITEVMDHFDLAPSTVNWRGYVDQIADTFKRREAIRVLTKTTEQAYDISEPTDDVVDAALADLSKLNRSARQDHDGTLDDALHELDDIEIRRLELADEEGRGGSDALSTGIEALDSRVSIYKGDLVVLQAHTSHGKTALALEIARSQILGDDRGPVAFYSAEMRRPLLARRLVSQTCQIDATRQRMGWLDNQERAEWVAGSRMLAGAPMWINDRGGLNVLQLVAWIKAKQRQVIDLGWEEGLRLVVVDYMQRMGGTWPRQPRQEAVTEMARELKNAATALNVPILALARPNRASLAGNNKRPQLHDLRESGAIEQEADTVLAGYWHAKTLTEDKREGLLHVYEVEIQKQRNGATGRAVIHFTPQTTSFRDMQDDERDYTAYA